MHSNIISAPESRFPGRFEKLGELPLGADVEQQEQRGLREGVAREADPSLDAQDTARRTEDERSPRAPAGSGETRGFFARKPGQATPGRSARRGPPEASLTIHHNNNSSAVTHMFCSCIRFVCLAFRSTRGASTAPASPPFGPGAAVDALVDAIVGLDPGTRAKELIPAGLSAVFPQLCLISRQGASKAQRCNGDGAG